MKVRRWWAWRTQRKFLWDLCYNQSNRTLPYLESRFWSGSWPFWAFCFCHSWNWSIISFAVPPPAPRLLFRSFTFLWFLSSLVFQSMEKTPGLIPTVMRAAQSVPSSPQPRATAYFPERRFRNPGAFGKHRQEVKQNRKTENYSKELHRVWGNWLSQNPNILPERKNIEQVWNIRVWISGFSFFVSWSPHSYIPRMGSLGMHCPSHMPFYKTKKNFHDTRGIFISRALGFSQQEYIWWWNSYTDMSPAEGLVLHIYFIFTFGKPFEGLPHDTHSRAETHDPVC